MNGYFGSMMLAVANHLWQSTLVIAAAWLLTLMLRTNTARTRQRIWMAASLKFLLPFSLLVAAGSHMVHPKPAVQSAPTFYTTMDQWVQPAPAIAAAVQPGVSTNRKGQHTVRDAAPMLLAAVWLCGFAVVVSLWVVRWRRLQRVKRAAIPMPGGREKAALLRVQQRNGTRSAIRMLRIKGQAGRRMEPGVMGVRRQVLLWPDGISERLSDAQLETILAHELQHVKHRDNLMALLHMAVEAMFWFHPLVWWMEARLVEERERACDEEVLRMGNKPAVYAQSILKTCEFCLESPMACVAGVTGGELKKRIVQIMSRQMGRQLSLTKKVLLATAAVLLAAGPLVFGLVYATQVRAQAAVFEVASVRLVDAHTVDDLSRGIGQGSMSSFPTNLFTVKNMPLTFLVQLAYNVDSQDHISAMPGWMESQEYDISAKVEGDRQLTLDEMRPMLQHLLEQRFHFAAHSESKTVSGFALIVAKGGSRLQPSKDGSRLFAQILPNRIDVGHMKIAQIAGVFAHRAGQPVADKTGLTGTYDFKVSYAPANDANSDLPDFFTALQEQLGLKLQPDKVPVSYLVVDHADKIPTEN